MLNTLLLKLRSPQYNLAAIPFSAYGFTPFTCFHALSFLKRLVIGTYLSQRTPVNILTSCILRGSLQRSPGRRRLGCGVLLDQRGSKAFLHVGSAHPPCLGQLSGRASHTAPHSSNQKPQNFLGPKVKGGRKSLCPQPSVGAVGRGGSCQCTSLRGGVAHSTGLSLPALHGSDAERWVPQDEIHNTHTHTHPPKQMGNPVSHSHFSAY